MADNTDRFGSVGLAPAGRLEAAAALVTAVVLVVHLLLAGHMDLMYDEAYYASWARHLDWGYLDHPPMVAAFIRLSTMLFGDSEFGVRALGSLAAAAGSGLIYLIGRDLFAERTTAALAVLFYSSMLLIGVGALIETPDTPLVLFSSLAFYGLVQVFKCARQTGMAIAHNRSSYWWWLVGAMAGLALQSKYTGVLLGAGIATAMLVVPSMRRWWRDPGPYLGGMLALLIALPVLYWNARHGWASFDKQFGRAAGSGLTSKYIFEFLLGQIGLMTPFVFVLAMAGVGGVWRPSARHRSAEVDTAAAPGDAHEARLLLVASIGPMILYFLVHSLHDRVQGNWPAPAYPALALLAADAARRVAEFGPRTAAVLRFCRSWAVPVGLGLAAIVYLQAWTAILPLSAGLDPTSQMRGWRQLGRQVDGLQRVTDARFVLVSDYGLAGELTTYKSPTPPVIQFNQRMRWVAFPQPDEALFAATGIYVAEETHDFSCALTHRFAQIERLGDLERASYGRRASRYVVYRVSHATAPVLEPVDAWRRKRPEACDASTATGAPASSPAGAAGGSVKETITPPR